VVFYASTWPEQPAEEALLSQVDRSSFLCPSVCSGCNQTCETR